MSSEKVPISTILSTSFAIANTMVGSAVLLVPMSF